MDFAGNPGSRLDSILAFDSPALERWLAESGPGSSASGDLGPELGRIWLLLMRGESKALAAEPPTPLTRAGADRDPTQVIEATALRAMLSLSAGNLADAVALARRASMMARTEALPAGELLANLVLARVRRRSGKPHLAARIVEALGRLSPANRCGWLEWEALLAGGTRPDAATTSATTPAAMAAQAGRALLLAARAGDRAAFEQAHERLLHATAGFHDMHEEAVALVALLDADRAAPASLDAFKHGESAELGPGLYGAVVVSDGEEPGTTVFAAARPGQRGGRVLRDGLGLFGAHRMLSADDGLRRSQGRTDAAVAALALAVPDPLAEEKFFARVYGFAYVPAKHRGALDTLLHRIRARLGTAGTVARSGGHLHLELAGPIAVADPHCAPPAAARILSALSRQPQATADAIATRLGITVRAAQIALQQLVVDGACTVRRRGRAMEYQLQDTTFSEPTSTDVLRQGSAPPTGPAKNS